MYFEHISAGSLSPSIAKPGLLQGQTAAVLMADRLRVGHLPSRRRLVVLAHDLFVVLAHDLFVVLAHNLFVVLAARRAICG